MSRAEARFCTTKSSAPGGAVYRDQARCARASSERLREALRLQERQAPQQQAWQSETGMPPLGFRTGASPWCVWQDFLQP